MKKITLVVIAFFVAIAAQSQIIYDQANDGESGIVSDYYDVASGGAFSADDFELAEAQDIYSVRFYGFQGLGDLQSSGILSGVKLYIYTDASGEPSGYPGGGAGELELTLSVGDDGLDVEKVEEEGFAPNYNFTVDIEAAEGSALSLDAGTYWIVAAPTLDLDPQAEQDGQRWNWLNSTETFGTTPKLIDPSGIFGVGPEWTPINDIVADGGFDALAFTLYDENLGVINEQPAAETQIYPNPVQDNLNVRVGKDVQIESAQMVDLLGKVRNVEVSNGSINTSSFASGVYILKLETNQGSLSKKIVKQ